MKVLALSALALLASISATSAQAEKVVNSEFEIRGNDRTRSGFIEKRAKACLIDIQESQIVDSGQQKYFEQCLMNSKLFANVKVDPRAKPIVIEVEEKWTLIPAPFYQSSGSTRRAGLIVFETNFLGQGLTLALGGNTSNKGSGFVGFFTNPSLFESNFFTTISFVKESNIYELVTEDERVSQAFFEKNFGYNLALGYRFPWLNTSISFGRTERSYSEQDDYIIPDAYYLNRAGLTLDYDKRDYKLYFSDGLYARIKMQKSFAESDREKSFNYLESTLSWQFNAFKDHALLLMFQGLKYENGRITDTDRVGSAKGFRGIETKTAWAKSYFSQTIEYQIPLKAFEKGTLTTAAFFDHGRIENRGVREVTTEYSAAGAGVYFFLSRIALPGLGLEYGLNTKYQKSFVNFSVGLSY